MSEEPHDAATALELAMMGLPGSKTLISVSHYLATERTAEQRHIYLDGEVFAMAGVSLDHGKRSASLVGLVVTQLRGTSFQAFTKDTKVLSGPLPRLHLSTKGFFSYPDLVVVCGDGSVR